MAQSQHFEKILLLLGWKDCNRFGPLILSLKEILALGYIHGSAFEDYATLRREWKWSSIIHLH